MPIGVIHAVGVLFACNRFREKLHFQVRLQQFNVHQFAFGSVSAVCTYHVEREISVVRLNESMHQRRIHVLYCALRYAPRPSEQRLSSSLSKAYTGPVLGMEPHQHSQAGNLQWPNRQGRDRQRRMHGAFPHCPNHPCDRNHAPESGFPIRIHATKSNTRRTLIHDP